MKGQRVRLLQRPQPTGARLRRSAAATSVLVFALYLWSTAERRVDEQMHYAHERARQYWSALVEVGVSQDSATTLILRETQDRFAGQSAATIRLPFIVSQDAELTWQSRMLNPLQPTGANLPRTTAESLHVSARRARFEKLFREGREVVERRVLTSSLLWIAAFSLIVIGSSVWLETYVRTSALR